MSRSRVPVAFGVLCIAVLLALCALSPLAAQPAFVGVATGNNAETSSSLTVAVPSGAAGDLLIAVIGVEENPSTPTPAGWTAITNFTGFNSAICASGDGIGIRCQLSAFYKIATSASESSVTWNFDTAGNIKTGAGAILRYDSNFNTADPIGDTGRMNGEGTTLTAPSVNAADSNSRILRIAVSDATQARSLLTGGPATQRFNLGSANNLNSVGEAVVIAGSDAVQGTAGATGTETWNISVEEQWVAGTIVIRPTAVVINADLEISKDDNPDKVNPGGALAYTIVVSNNGPSDVTGASVADNFDSDLTCSWTCSAAGGSACGAGAGVGNIAETVDVVVGDDVTFAVACTVDGGASGSIPNTAMVSVPSGITDTDPSNNSAQTTTAINQAPLAVCQDVELVADQVACLADVASSADFDGGSSDPDNDLPLSFSHSPLGDYGLGDTAITLTVEDALGLTDTCPATVTVVDEASPVIWCNSPPTIVPPDAPISFTATATDACGPTTVTIDSFDCFKFTKKGKRIDKTGSCSVSIVNDTITVLDSGGVGDNITWLVTAVDTSGNSISMTCKVVVVNPGHN